MINQIKARLAASPSARLDAELLLANALGISTAQLYTQPCCRLTTRQQDILEAGIRRREQGEPMAYILGTKGFWSLELEVNPSTLIPRPATELLVEAVLAHLPSKSVHEVLDLGTGSGAIALAIASERPHWQLTASDYYPDTLDTAKRNAKLCKLSNITFILSDWCEQLDGMKFDAIVSNPPYIRTNDLHLKQGDLRFEPKRALVAGKDGLTALREVIHGSHALLKPGGYVLLEHGFDQGESVRNLMKTAGYLNIQQYQDLDCHERVVIGRLSS